MQVHSDKIQLFYYTALEKREQLIKKMFFRLAGKVYNRWKGFNAFNLCIFRYIVLTKDFMEPT